VKRGLRAKWLRVAEIESEESCERPISPNLKLRRASIETEMPIVSRFFGIVIRFYYNDQEQGHFHAAYGEQEALIEIETLVVLRGELPGERWPWF
jgi:hypothetical protein